MSARTLTAWPVIILALVLVVASLRRAHGVRRNMRLFIALVGGYVTILYTLLAFNLVAIGGTSALLRWVSQFLLIGLLLAEVISSEK
jgi:hypothetical protein